MLSRCLSSFLLRLLALLARWLKKPLHHYVSFKRDYPFLTLGLTGFTIKFEHLRLLQRGWNSEFLRASLPLQLHSVLIESLSVHCGLWSAVTVEASGVYVLLKTTNNKYYDADVEKKNALHQKRERLDALHFAGEKVPVKKQGWIRQQVSNLGNFLLFALIKRTELSVSRVHLRLEDELSHEEEPVAAGILVESAALNNAESEKMVEVHCVSAYWNSGKNRELFGRSNEASATTKLQEFPFQDALGCDYVLKPTTVLGNLLLRKGASHSYFDVTLYLRILQSSSFKAQISKEQLDSVTKFLGFIKEQERFRCFLEFRPHIRPLTKDGIKLWWQYAFNSVVKYIKGRRGQTVWDRFILHRSLYKEYSELYEESLTGKNLNNSQKLKMKAMEEQMELLEIVSCRSKVWRALRLRRLVEDLADYGTCYTCSKDNPKKSRVSKEVLKIAQPEMSAFSLSLNCECDSMELLLTEASADEYRDCTILRVHGSGLNFGLSHQPHLSSVEAKIDCFAVSGFTRDKNGSCGPQLLYDSRGLTPSTDRPPLLSMRLGISHRHPGSDHRKGWLHTAATPDSDITDNHMTANLQQMVLVFDKQTALKLAEVAATLFNNFNADLKFYLKEQAYELKYQGEKKIEEVVANQEIVSVNADAHLPLLILPGTSGDHSPSDLAVKLGHLRLTTSVEDQSDETSVVKHKAKLTGTIVAFNLQEENWREEGSKDFTSGNSTRLLNCPQVDVGVTTILSDSHSTPRVQVNGSVSSIDLGLSNGILEAFVTAASHQINTLLELKEVAVVTMQASKKEDTHKTLHRYVSKTELTPSRLVEVATRINQPVITAISRQSLQGGGVEEVDSSSRVSPNPGEGVPILKVSFLIREVSLEVTSEVRSLLNYLGGSVEGLQLEIEQGRGGLRCRLNLSAASLVDSCINSKGLEVRAPYPVLAAQSNKSGGQFFTANVRMVDSVLGTLRHQSVKNSVLADIGPLALTLSDASLFSWMEILVRYYVRICSIDFQRLGAEFIPSGKKASPPLRSPTTEKSLLQQRRHKGVINLDLRVVVTEVAVVLRSENVAITKLCVSGIQAELKDSALSTECNGSVDTVVLLDCLQVNETHSKVMYSNVSERVLQVKSSMKKKAPPSLRPTIVHTHSKPMLHPDALNADLRADITVGGVSCTLLFSFVTTLQGYFMNIASNVSKDLQILESSRKTVEPPSKPKSNPFKWNLSLNMHTLSVKFPAGGNNSTDAVQVQLESLLLSNKYSSGHELSGAGGESYLSVAETVQLDFHQLSVSRFDGEEAFDVACIPQFRVSLTRLLSTGIPMQALCSEPQFKVTVSAEILEIYASNNDLYAVLLVVQGNFGEEALMSFVVPEGEEKDAIKKLSDQSDESLVSTDCKEEKEEMLTRNLLQLDASLKKVRWMLRFIESNKGLLPSGNSLHVVIAEIIVDELSSLLDIDSNGCLHGDAWMMDVTVKELPNNHGYNSLDRKNAFILKQELYYRKTKPPKLGGGTMDTRRSSYDDTVVKAEFSYFQGDVKVGLTVQHIHMCVWPHLISPFLSLGTGTTPSSPPPPSSVRERKDIKPKKKKEAGSVRAEITLGMNNVSLALVDKPSDMTSYGVCAEVISRQFSNMKLVASASEIQLSSDALHFEANMMQFGKKIAKLVQVVDPCSLCFSVRMEELEDFAKITASPIVVSLSMETITAILKPISNALKDSTSEHHKVLLQKPSKLSNIWELKEVSSEAVPLDGDPLVGVARGGIAGKDVDEVDGGEDDVFDGDKDVVSKKQRAELNLPVVVLNFDLIFGGSSNTMLSLTSVVEAVATSWSSKLEVDAKLELSGFIHNQRVASWEPLLEPLEDPVHSKYRRWAVIAKVRQIDTDVNFRPVYRDSVRGSLSAAAGDVGKLGVSVRTSSRESSTASEALTDFVAPLLEGEGGSREGGASPRLGAKVEMEKREGKEEEDSSLVLLVSSDDRLEVTLSPGALETLLKIVEASRLEDSILEKNLAGCSYINVKPMQIRNQTGLSISVYPGSTFTLGNPQFSKHIELSPIAMGNSGAVDVSQEDPSVAKLHYANVDSKKGGREASGRFEGEMAKDRVSSASGKEGDAVMEELNDVMSHFLSGSGGKEMQVKADSLTKLRGVLQKHRAAGEDAADLCPPARGPFANWFPRQSSYHKICVQSKGGKKSHPISVSLPGLVPIPLFDPSYSGLGYGKKLVGLCEVEEVNGVRIVTIRSSVQIRNDYPLNVTLYQHSELGTKQLVVLQPGDAYNLPVPLYMEKTPLKIGIGESGFFGEDVLDWSSTLEELDKPVYISCPVDLSSRRKYYLQVLVSLQAVTADLNLLSTHFYLISLKPTLSFHNLLPLTVRVAEKDSQFEAVHDHHHHLHLPHHHHAPPISPREGVGSAESEVTTLEPGETANLSFTDPSKELELAIEIPNYKGAKWRGVLELEATSSYRTHLRVKLRRCTDSVEYNGDYTKMKIGVYSDMSSPSLYRLYCPYWICNRTGLSLEYEYYSRTLHNVKGIVDDGAENSLTLVYFRPNLENKDKKLRVRVGHDGQLSKTIYLGNTGEAAEITARAKDGTVHELTVQSNYSLHVLTQVVHILPKYVVHNLTEYQVRLSGYSENTRKLAEDHVVLDSNEVKVFWPNTHKVGVVHFHGPKEKDIWLHTSMPFHLTKIGTLSLPLRPGDEVLSAVTIKVSPAHSGSLVLVTISPYVEGTAVYRLENLSKKLTLKIRQSSSRTELLIPAGHTKLYSWHDPLLPWQLYWQVLGEGPDSWTLMEEVFEDGCRDVALVEEEGKSGKVCWRMVYDGSQKVFQLFDSTHSYRKAEKSSKPPALLLSELLSKDSQMKPTSVQVFCSMEGIGLSLLNDKPVEVLYCSIESSPVVWLKRGRDGGKFRVLDDSQQQLDLEGSWRSGLKEKKIESETFDLSTLRGNRGGTLKRSFHSGLWGFLLVTESHLIVRTEVGRVQVDNQLEDYALDSRVVFSGEHGLGAESAVAPMVDAAVIIRRPNARQQITLFEDAYVKVKNLQVNAELGVVAAIIPLVQPLLSVQGLQDAGDLFAYGAISSVASASIREVLLRETPDAKSNFRFKGLAISPIKIAVTYTTIIAGPYDLSNILGNVVDSIIHFTNAFANGTIPIKLDSFKFTGEIGATELYTILFSHYRNEVLGHIHAVLFGLDLIGNPSKLLANIETGVKELIDESEKGFERHTRGSGVTGVAVGVKDLLGHVLEGSTGSLGSTTGSFRNTLLETTDLDYKRRHRQLEHEASETLGANLLLGTRFFAEGLIGGLTDIFRQPISGASSSGAKGFFHGLGKGALAILTKPTLGVVDLAYFTLEGIRCFADDDSELQAVRLPRLVHPNKIVTPYTIHEAQGLGILWRNPDNSKGTQYYGHHWLPTEEGKEPRLLLVNSLHILKLKRSGRFFKVDDLSVKLEYLQEWVAMTENNDTASLFLKYGDDGKLDKLSSFLGFGKVDHYAEVLDKTAMVEVDSLQTGKFLASRITEACKGVLVYYARLMSSSK